MGGARSKVRGCRCTKVRVGGDTEHGERIRYESTVTLHDLSCDQEFLR